MPSYEMKPKNSTYNGLNINLKKQQAQYVIVFYEMKFGNANIFYGVLSFSVIICFRNHMFKMSTNKQNFALYAS